MPSLAAHQSNDFTKLLLLGDSGSGKTGALASLVKAGYKLRILDFDNGLDILKEMILHTCPENLGNVEFRTLRDKYKSSAEGPVISGAAKAFVDAIKMLDRWKYTIDGVETDLGIPAEWGPECILVLDSMSFLSDAAWAFREPLVVKGKDGKYDVRALYKDTQDAVESVLALLTSANFATNVIVTAHIRYIENDDGSTKGYPNAAGKALGPVIPRYFNSMAQVETKAGGKRTIRTTSTAMIDLKNTAPFKMAKDYPIETGLADFFAVLRPAPTAAKPTKLTMQRKA